MSLPRWMGRLAQQWLPRGGKRRRVRPCLEMLEDRLTPSGDVLAFTTAAQSLGLSDPSHGLSQPSHAITVQLQDTSGKAVIATSNVTINLSSTSSGGQFLNTSGFALKNSQLIIPKGANSASFEYEDSQIGIPTVQAKATALNVGASQQESVGVFLVFANPPPMLTPGQPSLPITVQLEEQSNGLFFAPSPITIQLTSSSGTGQFLDVSNKSLPGGRLTIAAGSSSAQFEYKDTKAGLPTLTGTLNGSSATTQVNDGVSLVFTTPAQNLKAGQKSQTITVQLQDPSGKAVAAPNTLGFSLSSSSGYGTFFDIKGNPFPNYYYALSSGASSVSFQYKDTVGGKPVLSATVMSMTGLGIGADQQETVAGPYNVRLEAPPQTIAPNQPSQPITVQLFDSSGHAVAVSSAVTVQLSSSSSTGKFLDTSGNVLPGGRLTIQAGSSSAQFEYQDSQAGFPALTATENGASDTASVNVGVSLAFITPAQNLKAGQKSQTITVQLQDPNGKAFAAPGIMPLYLTSNSQTGRFFDASGNPLLYGITLQAGASSVRFQYQDSVGGKPTLTATAVTFSQVQISTAQKETVAGLYNPSFLTRGLLPTIAPNKPSQPLTVQLLDSTGNVATASSNVTVQLGSSSSTGKFLDASGNALPGGRLTIRAGSSAAQFEYEDSQTGFPMLTATENGFSASTRVNVGVSLVFTTPAQNFKTGQSSGTITLQLQDSHGKPFLASSELGIYVSSSLSTVQFQGSSSPMMYNYLTILPGSSSASFAITSSWGGTPTLTATMSNAELTATQQETIQGLSTLAFTTPPQTLTAGQKSHPVTLQLEDNKGHPAVAPSGGLVIFLAGDASGGFSGPAMTFFDANGKPLPTSSPPYFPSLKSTSLLMPAGSSMVSFEFESTQAGSIPVSAQVSAGPSWSQVETVKAGSPHSLVFETPAQAQPTGVPSGSITVQLQDKYGNPVVAGSGGLTFTLHSSSSTGTFLSADGDPLAGSKITVPQGLSSATFEYKDSQVGKPTLTASADGVSGTQTESITPVSAEIHVTNKKDSGSGSLRAAIAAANAHPGSTIVFDTGVRGAIDLLSALPTITANMNILGPGANLLTIERSAAASTDFGIFVVGTSPYSAGEPSVVISGLTLANGTESGITNLGYLTLQRVVVRNNQVPVLPMSYSFEFPSGSAGGISNNGSLTVLNSTIANNSTMSASVAAGIDSEFGFGFVFSPVLTIINSTISGNKGLNSFRAGGIGVYGGTAVIENSTISGNVAGQQVGPLAGSGGIDSDGNVVLYDTLVAGNTGSLSNPTDVSGAFLSLGHNLFGQANQLSSGFASSDLLGSPGKPFDPKLGALANNGGPTPTLALLPGSPAIGMGSSVFAVATDQRGDPRPQGAIDIGAFEITTS